jgi:hypothetical protein
MLPAPVRRPMQVVVNAKPTLRGLMPSEQLASDETLAPCLPARRASPSERLTGLSAIDCRDASRADLLGADLEGCRSETVGATYRAPRDVLQTATAPTEEDLAEAESESDVRHAHGCEWGRRL